MTVPTLGDRSLWRTVTFVTPPGALGARAVELSGPEGHHAVDVARLRAGDLVRLIDGEGAEALGRVTQAGRGRAVAELLDRREHARSAHPFVTVFQALLKGRGMDEVVRRCSELGVSAVVPTTCRRVVARGLPAAAKLARWRDVARAATKQSRGVFVPRILDPVGLADIPDCLDGAGLVAWEEESSRSLSDVVRSLDRPRAIGLVVGPEGGLSGDEVRLLSDRGLAPVHVGRRIMRADWAAAAIASMLSYELGGLLP